MASCLSSENRIKIKRNVSLLFDFHNRLYHKTNPSTILSTAAPTTFLLPVHRCYGHNLTNTFSVWCMTSGSSLESVIGFSRGVQQHRLLCLTCDHKDGDIINVNPYRSLTALSIGVAEGGGSSTTLGTRNSCCTSS
jgi:hypothetical protein